MKTDATALAARRRQPRPGTQPDPRPVALLHAALRLMRVEKPLAAAALTGLGAWLAGPEAALLWGRVAAGALCVFFLTGFGFVINDCCDLRVDAIGRPARPLPARRASLRTARVLAATLAAAGLAIGVALGGLATAFAVAATVLGALYSVRLKNTVLWGNACVALLVAAVPPFGALLVGTMPAAVWIAAGICFAYILAQEALFTLEDEAADRAAGLRTTATVLGVEAAARLVRGLLAVFFVVALAPWALGLAPALYPVVLAAVSLAPAVVLIAWLRSPPDRMRVARAARLSRWIWLTSFLPLALLR